MLDMSLMRGVWVDPAQRVARAQAGCLLGDVDRETQLHGLAAVLGFVSNTGCAGLTLGGGFGYLTRRFGWTSDNLASVDLVTADGRVVRASERENSDLFWGLRGGGGNFGVVTSFDYRLHPVGPEIVGGRDRLARRGGAGRCSRCIGRWWRRRPRELTCVAGAAPGAAGALARQGRPRQADRRAVRLLLGPAGRRREACSRRSRRSARRSATSCSSGRTSRSRRCSTPRSRRDAATTGSPSICRALEPGALHAGDRARRADRLAALGDPDLPARRRAERAARGPLRGRQPRRRLPCSTSPARGSAPRTTPPTSSGRGAPGATCASSRPAAPTSTSSPRRKATTARAPRTAATTAVWRGSRPRGIRPNLFRANKNIGPTSA